MINEIEDVPRNLPVEVDLNSLLRLACGPGGCGAGICRAKAIMVSGGDRRIRLIILTRLIGFLPCVVPSLSFQKTRQCCTFLDHDQAPGDLNLAPNSRRLSSDLLGRPGRSIQRRLLSAGNSSLRSKK